jgi:23S rRNA pseudouridine1911/1915/1917 synthase
LQIPRERPAARFRRQFFHWNVGGAFAKIPFMSNAPLNETDPEILLEDGPCIVVNKPGGLLTQAPPGIDSMETRLRRFLLRRENRTGNLYLATCHRLDRPVSGAMVFARNVRAARRLTTQFENRSVKKTYWAIVAGLVDPIAGQWSDFMRKVPGVPRSEVVSPEASDAQYALLHYQVLASGSAVSLLEIRLETGRTHQIRLQSASRGFPIVGDELYGSTESFGPTSDDVRLRWIGLMARELHFVHPMTKAPIEVVTPLSCPWREALDRWKLSLSARNELR